MRKSLRHFDRRRIYFFTGILCVITVAEFCFLFRYRSVSEDLEKQIKTGERMVYIASEKITKGSILTDENTVRERRYSDAPQDYFITEDPVGKVVAIDVAEGMYLTENMLVFGEENRRDVYVSEAEIPEHIQDGGRIDIRIRFSNAEDYLVLTDKIVQRETSGNGMILKLTEAEILILSSAVADKAGYPGVRLYVVGYPEYERAEAGKINYPVRKEISDLLGREYIEGESRNALENRLLQIQP